MSSLQCLLIFLSCMFWPLGLWLPCCLSCDFLCLNKTEWGQTASRSVPPALTGIAQWCYHLLFFGHLSEIFGWEMRSGFFGGRCLARILMTDAFVAWSLQKEREEAGSCGRDRWSVMLWSSKTGQSSQNSGANGAKAVVFLWVRELWLFHITSHSHWVGSADHPITLKYRTNG